MRNIFEEIRKLPLLRRSAKIMPNSVCINLLIGKLGLPDELKLDVSKFLIDLAKEYDCTVAQLLLNDEVAADIAAVMDLVLNLMKGGEEDEGNQYLG